MKRSDQKSYQIKIELMRQIFKHKKKAIAYFKSYGIRNFVVKSWQIAKSGGLAYYEAHDTKTQFSLNYSRLLSEVILVSNDFSSPSHEYRVANLSQALWEIGVTNTILSVDEIRFMERLPRQTCLVYFWRTSVNLTSFGWYKSALLDGVTIAFDSDDLTFERSTYNRKNVHALNLIPNTEAEFLINDVASLQESQVRQSTLGIACTKELENAFVRLGKKSIRIPIVLPRWLENEGVFLNKNFLKSKEKAGIDIIYCSGSRSHNLDFKSASKGLFEFLKYNTDSTLTIQGASPLTSKDIPSNIRAQINFQPMLSHRDFLRYLSAFDVQIAPLEMNNPFVEAKSATKYMQGGIVRVPTVATPTQPFIDCIRHGVNGYLATTDNEWIDALTSLKNIKIRMKMGELAHRDVIENHCIGSILDQVESLVRSSRAAFRDNRRGSFISTDTRCNVVWLLPFFIPGSGGHRNVFRIASILEGNEFHSQIYFHEDLRDLTSLSALVEEHYGNFKFEIVTKKNILHEADMVVGVHNSSIPFAKIYAGKNAKIIYLVQDFEPWFTPMGVHALDALSTYFDDELNIITSGPWMSRKIQEIRGFAPPFFNFPVDTAIYKPDRQVDREGVLFFAKSDTPRRLFKLGIETLTTLHRHNPSLPITIFGSNHTPELPFKHRNLKLVPTLEQLSEIYSSHKLGIAFSPTNPSLVPYEMMACGLPVLDIDLPGSPMEKYGSHELLKPPVYGIAELLSRAHKLLGDENFWKSTSSAGLNFIKTMPTPQEASEVVLTFLRKLRDARDDD